ncbi:MAG: hypothetical protein ABIQ56_01765, partial [Chitinophagaceae bacterium]
MRRSILFLSVATQVSLLLFCTLSFAQPVLSNVEIIKGNLVRISPRLQDMPEHDVLDIGIKRSKIGANNPIPIKPHPVLNSRALPYGEDPVWQRGSNPANRTTSTGDTILTFPGILNTGVNPSDVNADVGINHIMQASNANNVTSFIRIFNKNGTPVTGNVLI